MTCQDFEKRSINPKNRSILLAEIELEYGNVINKLKLSVPKEQMPANKGYELKVENQTDCGMWTDICVYTFQMKTQTELFAFTCGFCAAKEKKKLKKQTEIQYGYYHQNIHYRILVQFHLLNPFQGQLLLI